MNIKIIMVLCLSLVTITTMAYAIPDSQCHKMASNKDRAVSKIAEFSNQGHSINPCTGQDEFWMSYWDTKEMHGRTVWISSDVMGYHGITEYIICIDGRAKVTQRIAAGFHARGWGAWFNFPIDGYTKEICDTL
jgi:hypothetical protein